MNLFVTFSITLLVILVALFYLAKVKTENLGSFFKWSGYLVLIAACGLLLFLMFKGVKRLMRPDRMPYKEMHHNFGGTKKMKSMKGGRYDCGATGKMDCGPGAGMESCCCCYGEMEMGGRGHGKMDGSRMRMESTTDTVDGKIIKKEIEILEKDK